MSVEIEFTPETGEQRDCGHDCGQVVVETNATNFPDGIIRYDIIVDVEVGTLTVEPSEGTFREVDGGIEADFTLENIGAGPVKIVRLTGLQFPAGMRLDHGQVGYPPYDLPAGGDWEYHIRMDSVPDESVDAGWVLFSDDPRRGRREIWFHWDP